MGLFRRSRSVAGAVLILGWGSGCIVAADLPDLGPAWFERLRAVETRTAALREWDAARRAISGDGHREGEDTAGYFAAMHRDIQVLRAPQPGRPDAWLVWWTHDYAAADEVLAGPDPDKYPPASARIPNDDREARESADLVWQPGDPWLESAGAFLTNEQGETLSDGNFLGCGVIADADGDGLLDWIEFSTVRLREKAPAGKEADSPRFQGDLALIGPIDPSADRRASWLANLRPDPASLDRSQRFDLRPRRDGKGVEIVAVLEHHADERRPKEFVLLPGQDPPENSGLVSLGSGDPHEAVNALASERFGWKKASVGRGSGDASEIRTGEPPRATLDSPRREFSVPPGIATLPPDKAALALVDHNRDDSHRERFDLVLEPPLPQYPEAGWVEVTVEPGWAETNFAVWWLREDGAERWFCEPKDGATAFAVATVPREPLAHWIAILAHLDRVRSVARDRVYDDLDHDRDGGDDHTILTIRAAVVDPSPRLAAFDPSVPTLWNAIRGPVDRPLTGVLAAVLGNAPPGWEAAGNFERRDLNAAAADLLRPGTIATVPPPLARQVIRLLGIHGREGEKPLLEALLDHWGPPDAGELAFSEARRERRVAERIVWSPPYDLSDAARHRLHLAIAKLRELEQRHADDTPVQLRESVLQTLRMFDSHDDPARLEAWSKEIDDPGAPWAIRRLEELKGNPPP